MPKPRKFKSFEGYKKSMAFIHMRDIKHKPGQEVIIAGKRHKPEIPKREEQCAKAGYCRTHGRIHYGMP